MDCKLSRNSTESLAMKSDATRDIRLVRQARRASQGVGSPTLGSARPEVDTVSTVRSKYMAWELYKGVEVPARRALRCAMRNSRLPSD